MNGYFTRQVSLKNTFVLSLSKDERIFPQATEVFRFVDESYAAYNQLIIP